MKNKQKEWRRMANKITVQIPDGNGDQKDLLLTGRMYKMFMAQQMKKEASPALKSFVNRMDDVSQTLSRYVKQTINNEEIPNAA